MLKFSPKMLFSNSRAMYNKAYYLNALAPASSAFSPLVVMLVL